MTGTTGIISALVLFVISLVVCGVVFTAVVFILWLFKKKPNCKLTSNIPHISGKRSSECEFTYEDVRKVSPLTETNLVQNVSYGYTLKQT